MPGTLCGQEFSDRNMGSIVRIMRTQETSQPLCFGGNFTNSFNTSRISGVGRLGEVMFHTGRLIGLERYWIARTPQIHSSRWFERADKVEAGTYI